MSQAQAEAGYVVPLTVGGVFLAIAAVGVLLIAYMIGCWCIDVWREGADRRACRRRERVEAGVARSVARAAEDAGRGGR